MSEPHRSDDEDLDMRFRNPYHAKRASTLLGAYLKPLARAIARQIQEIVPRYRDVDEVALVRHVELILDATRPVLEQSDDRRLSSVLLQIIDLRQASGFAISDFIVASLCGFPVLRRFFVAHSPDSAEGLRLFETFECVLLPTVGYIADTFARLSAQDSTLPSGVSLREIFDAGALAEITERFALHPVEADRS